uniref:immune-associated nucleotide-binding protein 9-like n=1 Tax=Erigeron canadensis TaxID=72917 RepID=UPI001CB9532B|nr:immune-associated nucleotide-binding protein 9-like [Erigeron canadensis]
MGGCSMADDDQSPLTLVLIGKTGNGKSATGNSILGAKNFESRRSFHGVTMKSELQTTKLENGQVLNVIDTPGIFDLSADVNFIRKEIVSCIDMSKDGIHAVLAVFSVCSRFSEGDQAAIRSLGTLFGDKIYDYVIIVFTCGDELEEEGKSFEDFLSDSPDELKEILLLCGNRRVLFENRTKDPVKKAKQVQELLSLVNTLLEKNGGKPYSCKMFTQEKQLIEIIETLGKLLKEERAARLKAEENAKKLEEELNKSWCVIM